MSIEISKRLVLINSASAMLTRLLGLTVVVWLFQYLFSHVPDEEFRVYAVISSVVLFLPLLIMAASGGLERFVAEAYSRGDTRRVTQITSTMAPIFLGIGLFVLGTGSLVAWNIDYLLTIPVEPDSAHPERLIDDARMMFFAMVLSTFVRISFMPFLIGLQVRQKHVWIHVIDLIGTVVWMAALFGLLFGVSTRALWVPVSMLPQAVITVSLSVIASRRSLPALRFQWSEMRRDLVRPLMSFGGWTMIGRIATIARVTAGPLALNELPGAGATTQVNTLKGGQLVDTRLMPLALVPLSTTLPMLTAMQATGQTDRLLRTYYRFCRYVLWAFMFAAVPLIAYRSELWPLYLGAEDFEKISAVTIVMTLLLVRSLTTFPQPVLAQIVGAKDMTRPMAIRVVVIEVLNVIGVLFAVQVLDAGAVGVGITMLSISAVGQPALIWTLGLKITGGTWRDWVRYTMVPGLVPALVAFPVCMILRQVLVPDTWLELGVSGAISCAAYLGAIFAFCLSPSERADAGKVFTKLRSLLPKRPG